MIYCTCCRWPSAAGDCSQEKKGRWLLPTLNYFQESINWNTKAVLSKHVCAGNMNLDVMRNESENCGQPAWQVTIMYSPQLVANDALLGERHYNPPQLIFLPYMHLKQVVLYIKQLLYTNWTDCKSFLHFFLIAQQLVCSFWLIYSLAWCTDIGREAMQSWHGLQVCHCYHEMVQFPLQVILTFVGCTSPLCRFSAYEAHYGQWSTAACSFRWQSAKSLAVVSLCQPSHSPTSKKPYHRDIPSYCSTSSTFEKHKYVTCKLVTSLTWVPAIQQSREVLNGMSLQKLTWVQWLRKRRKSSDMMSDMPDVQ